jgi:hypothetical protein
MLLLLSFFFSVSCGTIKQKKKKQTSYGTSRQHGAGGGQADSGSVVFDGIAASACPVFTRHFRASGLLPPLVRHVP